MASSWTTGSLVITAVISLSSCSSSAPLPASPVPETTAPAPPEPTRTPKAERFHDLEEMQRVLRCEDTSDLGVGNNQATLRGSGHCHFSWGSVVLFLVKRSHLEGWAEETSRVPSLVGPGWIVTAQSPEAAKAIQGFIGGELQGPGT